MNWIEWEELVDKAFIDLGFDVEKRNLSDVCQSMAYDAQRDGLGLHVSIPNFLVDIESKKHQGPIDFDIINNSFGIKDSLEKKGFAVVSVVASFEGFTNRAREVAREKGILLLSKEEKEILEKISSDIDQLRYHYIVKAKQYRVPNISGTKQFPFFDRLQEMLDIYYKIEQSDAPITSNKVVAELQQNQKFLETHSKFKKTGKFTFYGDYKLLFRKIMNLIYQKRVGNKVEIFLTDEGKKYHKLNRNEQMIFFLKKLLKYPGFNNFLELKLNAEHILEELKNYVEIKCFRNWLQYLGIDENKTELINSLLSCSKILIELDRLQLYDEVYLDVESSIKQLLIKLIN